MKIYIDLISQLDSGGMHYSQDISEVDLSDPDDVKVLTNDPQGEVLVHLGPSNYLDRYKIYVAHVQQWRQQFDKLESVDLRYDRQIIVNPDLQGAVKPPPLSFSAVKAAMAAGVKPARAGHSREDCAEAAGEAIWAPLSLQKNLLRSRRRKRSRRKLPTSHAASGRRKRRLRNG